MTTTVHFYIWFTLANPHTILIVDLPVCGGQASILGYMLDLNFCYITCAAVVVIVYWPSNTMPLWPYQTVLPTAL